MKKTVGKQLLAEYLLDSAREHKVIAQEMAKLREGPINGYFLNKKTDPFKIDMLQGDGWAGLQIFDFRSDEKKNIRGMVISNSCNISPENTHLTSINITFAPIIQLSKFRNRLVNKKINSDRINGYINQIKKQNVYKYFFLPENECIGEECIALLDELHTMPISNYNNKRKIFTLSQSGFYHFIMKLSILFCRLHENLDRK